MENIEKQVIKWHRETFAWANVDDIKKKFYEELAEFEQELLVDWEDEGDGPFGDSPIEEFVDMCIVFIAGLAKLNLPPLSEHIARKLAINKARKWNPDGTRDKEQP